MARKKNSKLVEPADTQEVAAPAAEPQKTGTDLSIDNIRAATKIIAIAAQRGAFKAEEMTAVGGTFDKLAKFVKTYDDAIAAAKQGEGNE